MTGVGPAAGPRSDRRSHRGAKGVHEGRTPNLDGMPDDAQSGNDSLHFIGTGIRKGDLRCWFYPEEPMTRLCSRNWASRSKFSDSVDKSPESESKLPTMFECSARNSVTAPANRCSPPTPWTRGCKVREKTYTRSATV